MIAIVRSHVLVDVNAIMGDSDGYSEDSAALSSRSDRTGNCNFDFFLIRRPLRSRQRPAYKKNQNYSFLYDRCGLGFGLGFVMSNMVSSSLSA